MNTSLNTTLNAILNKTMELDWNTCKKRFFAGEFSGVSTDTRTLKKNHVFFALKGENFDGHDFIDQAIQAGAGAIISMQNIEHAPIPWVCIDSLWALGDLAAQIDIQSPIPLIAITGSNGKTTIKSMLRAIFSEQNPLVTEGNFNNAIGLPLTLLQFNKTHRSIILEMGASMPGDIRYLCEIAKPTIALVNNVMPAHLAGLGSLEGVAQTKGEIYEGLDPNGIAIINADSEFAAYFKSRLADQRVLSFGLHAPTLDISAQDYEISPQGNRFLLITPKGSIQITCPLGGQHNLYNALAASSVGIAANLSLEAIAQGLANCTGEKGRLKRSRHASGAVLIDDTYNANPGSFTAAIEILALEQGIRILVMGDMGELGTHAQDLHAGIGCFAKEKGIDYLLAVGDLSKYAVENFGEQGYWYQDKASLIQALKTLLTKQMICLIKGSRSAKMEDIVQSLQSDGLC